MAKFIFTAPGGAKYQVSGPEGLTQKQAEAIFKQQVNTGSLVGIANGDAISAATQATDGLAAAQSQLTQSAGSIVGAVAPGTNLESITASIGVDGRGATGQTLSSLTGQAAKINSYAIGSTGTAAGFLPGELSVPSVGVVSKALTGFAAQPGSLAAQAVKTVSGLVGKTPLSAINTADVVKGGLASSSISNLSLPDVSGAMASASKLVGQGVDKVSNALGVGKFGFDTKQLERAGFIKPGTTASFLATGVNTLSGILKSPTVWTGKGGVKGLDGLLGNTGLQNNIQQDLMSQGVSALKNLGVPTNNLNPQALAGIANNAAKSVENTVAWAKNSASLPASIKSTFDSVATNASFAVNFVKSKLGAPVLQEEVVTPAVNTVNVTTVNAAARRIVGNDKVPNVLGG